MATKHDELRSIPLLAGLSEQQLSRLLEACEEIELAKGDTLFSAGEQARALYILVDGEVTLTDADQLRISLRPPTPIGELGALTDFPRRTTATAEEASKVLQIARARLAELFREDMQLGLAFYQNLTHVLAEKIRRDEVRLEDMRGNIIRTQKMMKRLRDFVLESEDTPVSERLHDELQAQIRQNRRVNYRVAPPDSLFADVRVDGGARMPVVEISRTHLSYLSASGEQPKEGEHKIGVVSLAGPEIPISGTVLRTVGQRVDLALDLLIDEYVAALEGYLSRVQMVDFVV